MSRNISEERKLAFYIGTGLSILGLALFLSVFVTGIASFGNFDNFHGRAKSEGFRAFGGIILIIIGQAIRAIGARGLAGAGVVLDPEKARRDLEPHTRMAGGMVKDALDEAGIDLGGRSQPEKVVMIKCRACGKLNEEDSKFCQECGRAL